MDPDPLLGTKYRAIRRIGAGGHGEVYEAEHLELRRTCIVKLLRETLANDAAMNERFRIEAQSLATLSHPNVVSVTDFGRTQQGAAFFVMERLPGRTLAHVLAERGRVPVAQAIDWISQALVGLACVHAAGIVHRDLKPSNLLLVTRPESPPIVKVLDFGIAKILDAARPRIAPSAYPTEQGTMLGTPKYVSPEQGLGRAVDQRSDIYSLGLVLYVLVTGRGPFDHLRDELRVIAAHVKLPPEPPSRYSSDVPADLDSVILRAIAKRPDDRFNNADDFRRALEVVRRGLDGSNESALLASQSDTPSPSTQPPVSPFDPTVFASNRFQDSADSAPTVALVTLQRHSENELGGANDQTFETTAPTNDAHIARIISEAEATMLLEQADLPGPMGSDEPTRTARRAALQSQPPEPTPVPRPVDVEVSAKPVTLVTLALAFATTVVVAIVVSAVLGTCLQ